MKKKELGHRLTNGGHTWTPKIPHMVKAFSFAPMKRQAHWVTRIECAQPGSPGCFFSQLGRVAVSVAFLSFGPDSEEGDGPAPRRDSRIHDWRIISVLRVLLVACDWRI